MKRRFRWRFLLAAVAASCWANFSAARADENGDATPQPRQVALHLIRPGALSGWEYGEEQGKGWTVEDRRLAASEGAAPLVSGWTFGDVELNFRFSAGSDGALDLRLLDVPEGDGMSVRLGAVKNCGAISAGGKVLAKGLAQAPPADTEHAARLVRYGENLRIFIGDAEVAAVQIDAGRRFCLSLHVPQGEVSIADLTATLPLGEPLFNGENLTGWWVKEKKDAWKVEDGELVAQAKGGNYLRSEREFGNFTLSFDYKIKPGGNSGVGIRTPREGWPSRDGMEVQMLDRPGTNASAQMSIYTHFPPLERPDHSGQWNHVVIKAEGRMITAWVNGELAQHADTSTWPQTAGKPLRGWIGFQDHGAKTQFRNVYVLEAPDGLGHAAWQAAKSDAAEGGEKTSSGSEK